MLKRVVALSGLVWAVLLAGCMGTPAEVGVSSIPVFPGSRLENSEEFGSLMGESLGRMDPYTSTIWNFRTSAPASEVADWYKSRLPDADMEETDPAEYADLSEEDLEDEGIACYTFYGVIGNQHSDEDYTVEIGEGWYSICETLKD